ncbi:MAG: chemotaxis protein CheA [Alphaproteobacteria bacterium]|nr:chemotaxis protein CheA [Alphaproteobacteria bacterium]MBU1552203.1 chemotaxis protein CheA [Alphaproteobacteria bacterium]MBU2336887.1 chemotaxis protein CheA [Alphaproteobacteria bacterium]MBU2389644.1 chemotaxis protein CheA [Alphaproteobacteria bacterium]
MTSPDPIQVFRTEAAELFEQIESGLLDLLNDLTDRDRMDAVFRGLHTLKGSGAMFGFDALAAFTHHCETAFDRVRKGEVPATEGLVSAVLQAQDHMRMLIENPGGDFDQQGEALLHRLNAAIGLVDGDENARVAPETVALVARPGEVFTWKLKFSLPRNAMANGTNPLGLLDELADMGECEIVADRSQLPDLLSMSPADLYLRWEVTLKTDRPRREIEDIFIFVIDDMHLEINLENGIGQKADGPGAAPTSVESGAASNASAGGKSTKSDENVRVPAERLDELMDRVGELVIAQSRLSQLAASIANVQLRDVAEDVDRLSGELRDTMMVLRMVPVGSLFGRFRRLVHDLSRETGKSIELHTEGETTEVDKTVIERLADPLVHLVRNSIDHGLETPGERQSSGKSTTGRVTLAASQAGGEVVITIKDDGRGINRDRVRAKGEAAGLIQPGAAVSDQELFHLIFHPGFSTADKVTNLSGRGVGMDVVKRTVDALRGTIDIRSEDGAGSAISLRIPLTLAIIDGLLVRVGEARYVIPLSAVEECLEISLDDDIRSRGRSFISLRDSLVPYLRLREVFETGTQPELHQKCVIVATGSERVGLVVDQIIGDHQTVIKSMSKLHQHVDTFSGATILGDGGVALILDVAQLVSRGQKQEAHMRAVG